MSTQETNSITFWLRNLKTGEAEAAQQLWDRFFHKLIQQIEVKIRQYQCPPGMVDSEDVAASVFESLFRGAQAGRFDNVSGRDELWWLLLTLTQQKVVDHWRRESAQKRYPGRPPLSCSSDSKAAGVYEQLLSTEPDPQYVALLKDEYCRILGLLRDDRLRQIAVFRLEGLTNQEIADRVGISLPTVTRKLRLIQDTWLGETAGNGEP
ncbi:MAG: winged helix-turn-helix transcriptional regulator [Planctomycetaceae bacterium]|nr:winged helix-turn-helix transcriptional regulator [Planctomycetaceae bacterium]